MEQKQKIEFRKARDFGEVMNATSDFIRQNFKNLGLSLLFIAGPVLVLLGIVSGFNGVNVFSRDLHGFTFTLGLTYLVMFFAFLIIISVTYGYINLYLDRESGDISVDEVWEEVKKNFGKVFSTSIVSFLIIAGASLLLIIPGIFYSVVLSIVFVVRLRENLPIGDSVSRSQSLVSGSWWRTLGMIIVLYLIIYVFGLIFSIPQLIVIFLKLFGFSPEESVISSAIMIITSVIAAFHYIFQSIFYIAMAFHYYSLVEKKEAVGLMEKIDNIKEQI